VVLGGQRRLAGGVRAADDLPAGRGYANHELARDTRAVVHGGIRAAYGEHAGCDAKHGGTSGRPHRAKVSPDADIAIECAARFGDRMQARASGVRAVGVWVRQIAAMMRIWRWRRSEQTRLPDPSSAAVVSRSCRGTFGRADASPAEEI